MKKSRRHFIVMTALAAALAMGTNPVFALSSLSEGELSDVTAQDGLTYSASSPGISATQFKLKTDTSSGIQADSMAMTPYGGPTSLGATLTLDAGAAGAATKPAFSIVEHLNRYRLGGVGTAGFTSTVIGDSVPARNFGQWALVTDMDFTMAGQPFIANPSTTKLRLSFTDAALFWRQNVGHATLTLDNINFLWDMSAGVVSIDTGGIRIAGDATFNIGFDAFYKNNADQNMASTTANDRPGIRYSWGGKLYDSLLYLRSGGIWNTSTNQATNVAFNGAAGTATNNMPTGMSDGVNIGMRWNYRDASNNNNFLWGIGHITGDQEYLEFGDWKNLEQASGAVANRYGFDIPLLVFDALNAGSATNAGGSLCWGSTMSGAACSGAGSLLGLRAGTVEGYSSEINRAGGAAFVQLIRNGNLLAWSNSVRVKRNPSAPVAEDGTAFGGNAAGGYSWGLIATMANINSNIYMYPGGSESASGSGSRNSGVMMDVLFTSQSFESSGFTEWLPNAAADKATCAATPTSAVCNTTRWSQGTHLMLADTAAQMGIGILGSSILLAADDMRLWLKDDAGTTGSNNLVGGIDLFSPRVRYNLKGLFGGAKLPNGQDLIRVANIDMNLEGLLNFRMSPPPTDVQSGKTAESNDYLAYSGAIRLRCGTISPFGCDGNAFADATGSTVASGSGSYISIEEPGKQGVALSFTDLSGDLAITEGVLQLRAAADTNADTAPNSGNKYSTTRADLTIANKVLIGASAASRLTDGTTGSGVGDGGAAGRALTGNIKFGGNDIMSMAIPAASTYYSLTIRAQ